MIRKILYVILVFLGVTVTVVGAYGEYTVCKTTTKESQPAQPERPKVTIVPCTTLVCNWDRSRVRKGTGIEIQWLERAGKVPPPTSQEFSVSINGKLWVLQRFQEYTYVHDPLLNRGQFYDGAGLKTDGSPAFVMKG